MARQDSAKITLRSLNRDRDSLKFPRLESKMTPLPPARQQIESSYRDLYRFGLTLFGESKPTILAVKESVSDWLRYSKTKDPSTSPVVPLFRSLYQRFQVWPFADREQLKDLPGPLAPLAKLDLELRAPLVLFLLKIHSIRDISAILEIPESEARIRIAQAKRRISRPS